MGAVGALVAAGLLLGAMEARAEAPELKEKTRDPERLAPFGLLLDAGIPEGAGLSAAFRPSRAVRLHLGATHNGIRLGGRAGITLLPMRGWYTPSFTFEVGHTLSGNSDKVARRMADTSQPPLFAMERVGYSYASTHLGFEVGAPGNFTVFLRAGVSWVELDVPNVEDLAEPFIASLGETGAKGGRFFYMMPSAKFGLIVYFG
ncbi:hypothetical protein [Hyalangium versicolor]|uniref:hypothetical protein n=1 Tax=Hyalangium versicolor TaxID=2861190 RepID=UPI001CCED1DD|nr:hypothetical protein [Hyalangium versicolor]